MKLVVEKVGSLARQSYGAVDKIKVVVVVIVVVVFVVVAVFCFCCFYFVAVIFLLLFLVCCCCCCFCLRVVFARFLSYKFKQQKGWLFNLMLP